MLATVTSKGQVTLPKSIRDHLAITAGTQLDFVVVGDVIHARPVNRSVRDIFGMLKKPGRHAISQKDMDAAIAAEATARFEMSNQPLASPTTKPSP